MGHKIEYRADRGLIVVTQAGEVRYSTLVEGLPEIAQLMEKRHTHLAVVDLREAFLQLSVPEVYFATKHLADQGILPGSRPAFIYPKTKVNVELSSFCALAARNRGYRTKLFETMEAAEDWLRESQPTEKEESAD